jgi:hypothetical protein
MMWIAVKKVMSHTNGPLAVPAALAEEVGIALALFRAAALDDSVQNPIRPFSDRGIEMALADPNAMRRGIDVIKIHFESGDKLHTVVQRILCFLELLKQQRSKPHALWANLVRHHDAFLPVVNGVAWCPAQGGSPFDTETFIKIVSQMTGRGDLFLGRIKPKM